MHKVARKSQKRWEQFNHIVDAVAPSLPTPTHVAVLLCCFRHGRQGGYFRASTKRIAESAGIHPRHARRVFDDLERWNVIVLTSEHKGPIPRVYQITFKPANRDTHVPTSNNLPPKLMGTPRAANGDILRA